MNGYQPRAFCSSNKAARLTIFVFKQKHKITFIFNSSFFLWNEQSKIWKLHGERQPSNADWNEMLCLRPLVSQCLHINTSSYTACYNLLEPHNFFQILAKNLTKWMYLAHIKRMKTCIWNSGSKSRFLPSKCWNLQARTKGSSLLDHIILTIPIGKPFFNSLKKCHLSSVKVTRKDQDPTTMMTTMLNSLKVFQLLEWKTETVIRDPSAIYIYREKKLTNLEKSRVIIKVLNLSPFYV